MQDQQFHAKPDARPHHALIITDDPIIEATATNTLRHARWQVQSSAGHAPWQALRARQEWQLIVVADDGTGLAERILQSWQAEVAAERSYVVVVASAPSLSQAMQYWGLLAYECLPLPLDPLRLLTLASQIAQLTNFKALANDYAATVAQPESTEPTFVGQSAAMLALGKQIVKLAPRAELRLFLTGETGTGKEVIAHKLHELSRRPGPFLAVNCAAMTESLLESELFGHEKGAFTGALQMKRGLWELAENGTLFLDEITEAAPSVQAKLLRALQENVIRRVGSNREIKVNARIIAASNRDLSVAVTEKTFRTDLFYRLGQTLRIPPLRERREDIPLLAVHFCRRAAPQCVIAPEAMNLLCSWHWPGNVRELESVMLKLTYLAGGVILPDHVLQQLQPARALPPWISLPFLSALEAIPDAPYPNLHTLRNWYAAVLFFRGHSEAEIARRLGLDPRTVAKALQEAREQFPLYPHTPNSSVAELSVAQ